MTQTLTQIIEDAKNELQQQWKEAEYPEDLVHEIADSSIPIYYNEIAEIAKSDISLMLDEPEIGAASGDNFQGMQNTAIAYVASNIYERISQELSELLYELQLDEAA